MVFQPGQTKTTWPTQGKMNIDNGGPQHTYLPTLAGTVTLNGATPQTVLTSAVTAGSIILLTLKTASGTVSPNAPNVLTITPGTGFTVAGTAGDNSTYNYVIIG